MATFDELDWDIFREIGNIGSGHASVAMSLLVDGKTHISRTEAILSSPKSLLRSELGGRDNVDILHLGIQGDLAGDSFILMFDGTSAQLSRLLMEKKGTRSFSDSISAIQEFGNILVGSYMNALSNLVHLSAIPKISNYFQQGRPEDALGAFGARPGKKTMAIKTQVMNTDYGISVAIFVLFDEGSLGKILARTKPKDILVLSTPKKAGLVKTLLQEYSNISVRHAEDLASAVSASKVRPSHLWLVEDALLHTTSLAALKKAVGKKAKVVILGKAAGKGLASYEKPLSKERLLRIIYES